MSTTELARTDLSTQQVAEHFVKSGYFKDAGDLSKAIVKILAGRELGIAPFAAMSGIHIVEGKPVLSATMMGALVKATGRYDYRVARHTAEGCEIVFYSSGGKEIGRSVYTMKDAAAAGLAKRPNWTKFPKAMVFARALSQGVRWHCPDVISVPVYTQEELQPDAPIDVEVLEPQAPPEPSPVKRTPRKQAPVDAVVESPPAREEQDPSPAQQEAPPPEGEEMPPWAE